MRFFSAADVEPDSDHHRVGSQLPEPTQLGMQSYEASVHPDAVTNGGFERFDRPGVTRWRDMENLSNWQANMVRNAARRLCGAAFALADLADEIAVCGQIIGDAFLEGNRVLVAGNGGSAACAQHFAAEFVGKLALDRPPLSAIALTTDSSATTAIANDWSYDDVFARQVAAHGRPGDVFVGISTSGASRNIVRAIGTASDSGLKTIALTGPVSSLEAHYTLRAGVRETARCQETHDLILHELAQIAERVVFPDLGDDASADRFPFTLRPGDLGAFRSWCTATGQSLVTTNGVFDLLHPGHVDSLRQAKRMGDRLVVLVNSDESVRRLKGNSRPVNDLCTRTEALWRTTIIDHIVVMADDSPADLLESLRPDVHCKGIEYASRPLPEREVVERNGGRVELLELLDGFSTTRLIDRMRRA